MNKVPILFLATRGLCLSFDTMRRFSLIHSFQNICDRLFFLILTLTTSVLPREKGSKKIMSCGVFLFSFSFFWSLLLFLFEPLSHLRKKNNVKVIASPPAICAALPCKQCRFCCSLAQHVLVNAVCTTRYVYIHHSQTSEKYKANNSPATSGGQSHVV